MALGETGYAERGKTRVKPLLKKWSRRGASSNSPKYLEGEFSEVRMQVLA
jgi:hypothetical protein